MKNKNKQKGFTMVELMVLAGMIGLIAAIAVPEVMRALDTVRQKKTMTDLTEWGVAMNAYMVDYGFFPYLPGGIDSPVGPGVFIYDMFQEKRYLIKALYLDGWNHNFRYTPGGIDMRTCAGYTIASSGKGGTVDPIIPVFTCFQCDIRLRKGQFISKPEGKQWDSSNGLDCPQTECMINTAGNEGPARGKR